MSSSPRPPIKHCPLCGVAMVGSRSTEGVGQFDTFSCLKCDTVITLTPPPRRPESER
jgi:hypothetical protein